MSNSCSGYSIPVSGVLPRIMLLLVVAMASGIYWNLGWPLSLPFIGLVFPVGMSIFIAWLCPKMSGGRMYGVYVATVFLSEAIRCLLYIVFGQGLQYLLRDGETQLVFIGIIVEQLILGGIIIGVLMWLKYSKSKTGRGAAGDSL